MCKHSCAPLSRWLLDTFGRDVLGAGAGVLDVAGGKGGLAFELANLNGVAATVLDPRPLSLSRHAVLLQARPHRVIVVRLLGVAGTGMR